MYEAYLRETETNREEITGLSDEIWGYAETAYREKRSMKALADRLESHGFRVERGLADIPTCFIATYGSGKPVIAIQAEYDALDGLSQESPVTEPKEIPGKTTGHGCGHNLFAGGSFAAALAVKAYLDDGHSGTLRFYGCPAEEGGAGKVFMVRAGLYDDVDAVVSWHPTDFSMVRTRPSLANVSVKYSFKGIAAHAGGSPEKGRSALDAAELMNVGANFLREHMDPAFRIHYAFLDAGGEAPNVVQAKAVLLYLIRATDTKEVAELKRRVDRLAEGAAYMTETEVKIEVQKAYSNLITVASLQKVANEALQELAYPVPTEEDLRFAKELQKTMHLSEEKLAAPPYELGARQPIPPKPHGGSTDTADVSWIAPTVQFHIGNWVIGTPGHSWQAVSQGKGRFAKEMMLYAGKAVAGTVMRLFDRPDTLEEIRTEHREKTKSGYICPIPPEIGPNVPEE